MKNLSIKEINTWRECILNSEFISECILNENELYDLAQLIGKEIKKNDGFIHLDLLVLCAVNCAYYYYDNEGFWKHFCKLLGLPLNNYYKDNLGNKIEAWLKKHELLRKERLGTFRYVGAILEQCGITERYLPRFAEFLNTLSEDYGWNGLCAIGFSQYKERIPAQGISKYLTDFLKDRAGWEFVRDVAKTMSQYQHDVIKKDDLFKLPGYRPGFWEKLLEHIRQSRRKDSSQTSTGLPIPKLIFDRDSEEIAICFDAEFVRQGYYRFNRQRVSKSRFVLTDENDFSESYRIEIRTSQGAWIQKEIEGWNPKKCDYALFVPDKSYVSNESSLNKGDYDLIVKENKFEVPERIIIGEDDLLFDFGYYKAYRIKISSLHDLSFLGMDLPERKIGGSFLSWQDEKAKMLQGASDFYDVFTGSLPEILVQKAELFRSGKFVLFADFGSGPVRQKITGDSQESVLSFKIPPGTKGKIWVESLARFREFSGQVTIDSLDFCLLPECSVEWPSHLLKNDEAPEIRFYTEKDMSFEIDGGPSLDSNQVWQIPPMKQVIEGSLKYENISVRLALRVFRSALRKKEGMPDNYFEKKDLFKGIGLVAAGVPATQSEIFLTLGERKYLLAELGTYGNSGKMSFSSKAIQDALEGVSEPLGCFALADRERIVRTEAIFLNTEDIKNHLVSGTFRQEWTDGIQNKKLSDFLGGMMQIINGNIRYVPADLVDGLPESLSEWGRELIDCAVVFDDIFAKDFQEDGLHNGLCWYRKAEAFCRGKSGSRAKQSVENLLDELREIKWRPEISRWQTQFEDIVKDVKADADLDKLIAEWAEEVKGDWKISFKSQIASKEMGNKLTNAWRLYYQQENYLQAYRQSKEIFKKAESPVKELACILMNISLIRTGRSEQLTSSDAFQGHRKLMPHIQTLFCKAANRGLPDTKNEGVSPELFPMRDEDQDLLKRN